MAHPRCRRRRARRATGRAARALLREVDELHAELAPAYFRPATRAEPDWRRLLDDPTAAVLVAELPTVRATGRWSDSWSLRVYDTPADPTMVPRRRGHVETLVVGARAGAGAGIGRA